MGQRLFAFAFRRTRDYGPNTPSMGVLSIQRPYIDLTPADVMRWKLASKALEEHPGLLSAQYCTDRVANLPDSRSVSDDNSNTSTILLSFLISGLFYGLLHLAAWSAPFRSRTEALLWRISGITLASSGFVPLITWGFLMIYERVIFDYMRTRKMVERRDRMNRWFKWKYRYKGRNLTTRRILKETLDMMVLLFAGAGALLYLFSRVYLIVECFLTMPYLPPATLQLPQWSQYFIHFM
jgi:hypothetical protein